MDDDLRSAANIAEANFSEMFKRLDFMDQRIGMLWERLSTTLDKVDKVTDGIEPHIPEITKMVDDIAANPMFRMLTGGGRKK